MSFIFIIIHISICCFQLNPVSNSNTKYGVQRYGVPDIDIPSILIDFKGFNGNADSKYIFYCKENQRLHEKLKSKIETAQKRSSSLPSNAMNNLRATPLPTPTASTPSQIHPPSHDNGHTYVNDQMVTNNHLGLNQLRNHHPSVILMHIDQIECREQLIS